jgi:FkbM family methyltransferase
MLAWLAKLLESTDTPIGTVLHIGAGVGAELPLYRDLKCEHVLAIEPDSTLFKKLNAKAKRFHNVSVKQAWIADTAAERNATIFTNPRFNSLLPADNTLLTHFPNVKSNETLTVKTESFDELVTSNIKKTDEGLHLLILDVQGFETVLFKNSPASTLQLFNWIVVRGSDEVLFEGGSNTSEIKQSLTKQGFELRFSERNQLPFVEQYYELNKSIIELNTAKSQLEKLNNQSILEKEMLNEVNQRLSQKEALNTQLEEKLTKSDEQFSASQSSLNAQIGDLTNRTQTVQVEAEITAVKNVEITQQIENIKKSEQEKNEQIKLLEGTVDQSNQLLTQKEAINSQLQEKLTKSTELFKESRVSLDELKSQLNQEREIAKEKAKNIEALNAQIIALTDLSKTTHGELELATAKNVDARQQIEKFRQSEQEKNKQISSHQVQKDDLITQLDLAKQAFDESQKKLQNEAHWHEKNKKWAESLNGQSQELKHELTERQKTSDLALKLQTKAQADLDDLREKYKAKHHNEQKLVDLIKELRQKLQQASKFYFYLQEQYPNLTELEEPNQVLPVDNSVEAKSRVENQDKVSVRRTVRKKANNKL